MQLFKIRPEVHESLFTHRPRKTQSLWTLSTRSIPVVDTLERDHDKGQVRKQLKCRIAKRSEIILEIIEIRPEIIYFKITKDSKMLLFAVDLQCKLTPLLQQCLRFITSFPHGVPSRT